jgi:hypothetical protein
VCEKKKKREKERKERKKDSSEERKKEIKEGRKKEGRKGVKKGRKKKGMVNHACQMSISALCSTHRFHLFTYISLYHASVSVQV